MNNHQSCPLPRPDPPHHHPISPTSHFLLTTNACPVEPCPNLPLNPCSSESPWVHQCIESASSQQVCLAYGRRVLCNYCKAAFIGATLIMVDGRGAGLGHYFILLTNVHSRAYSSLDLARASVSGINHLYQHYMIIWEELE